MTTDASKSARNEAARPADIPWVFDMVHIFGEETFLVDYEFIVIRLTLYEWLTEDSYEKNLIADSGNIFATDNPFPTQKASTPPSRYI